MRTPGKTAQAYHDIERMIVFGELAPGSLVSESQLMQQTGLGRTPVREALQQLSRNRMVEIHPNKGVLIPPASVEDQLCLLELRRALEVLAVRLACERAAPRQRADMAAMADRIEASSLVELRDYAETIKGTHDLIAAGSHNDYLSIALAPLQGLSRRFWLTHVIDDAREIGTGASHHVRLLRAVVARDADTAEAVSLELNDYLVDFAYGTLHHAAAHN